MTTLNLQYFLAHPIPGDQSLHSLVNNVLRASGMKPIVLAEPLPMNGSRITSATHIRAAIERASVLIADISGASPNVMYEVGFAQGLRKPILPIIHSGEEQIPANLSGTQYLVYDPTHEEDFRKLLARWAQNYLRNWSAVRG